MRISIVVILLSLGLVACIPEADKNEVVPGFAGKATRMEGGKIRFHYDFSTPEQLKDWQGHDKAEVEIKDGKLWVKNGTPAVAKFKTELRVERLVVRSACVKNKWSPHINVYLNNRWNGDWEGEWGAGFILRGDYALYCFDGRSTENVFDLGCKEGLTYEQEFKIAPGGALSWTIDKKKRFTKNEAKLAGRSGHLCLGAYEATATFDDIVIEGYIVPKEAQSTK